MADRKIKEHLAMVSVPDQPLRTEPPRMSKQLARSTKRYTTIILIQKTAVLALVALLSLGCYVGISHYFVESVQVVGVSMNPTLKDHSEYILNRWTLRNRKPQRGDIVVLRDPEDKGISVKRVIALEGESVHFLHGKVYINGQELKEPYLAPGTFTFTHSLTHEQFITCGKDRYFVLGDNRAASIDSRVYGGVSSEDILGLVEVQ
jgi:signal peptidase I